MSVVVVKSIFLKSTSLRAQVLFMNYSIRIRHNKSCEVKSSFRLGEIYDQLHMQHWKLVNNISDGWLRNKKKKQKLSKGINKLNFKFINKK